MARLEASGKLSAKNTSLNSMGPFVGAILQFIAQGLGKRRSGCCHRETSRRPIQGEADARLKPNPNSDKKPQENRAFFSRVPCVTPREETEWVETAEPGWNTLVGCDPERIIRAALEAQPGVKSTRRYGDGRAAERIVRVLTGL